MKYGCDGTSGFTQYKQAFTEARNDDGNSVFLICMVPRFLRFSDQGHQQITFWENKYPSSTKLCRPIKYLFENESCNLIKSKIDDIQNQTRKLLPAKIVVQGQEIVVHFTLHCTMVDGKVRQVLFDMQSNPKRN